MELISRIIAGFYTMFRFTLLREAGKNAAVNEILMATRQSHKYEDSAPAYDYFATK